MTSHNEIESKWTVERPDFERLLGICRVVRVIQQLNVYFDNSWVLAEHGATCRIRFAPQAGVTFTLKIPIAWMPDGTREAREIEMPAAAALGSNSSVLLRELRPASLVPAARDALYSLNVQRLRRVGWMRNTRHVLVLPSGGTFELDCFTLPGGTLGFEVEVEESDAELRTSIVSAVRHIAPTAAPSQVSKFELFRAAAGTTC